ncbi:MAG: hypothetical protein V3V99_05395 [candidate division Zixibacteria bacterium]
MSRTIGLPGAVMCLTFVMVSDCAADKWNGQWFATIQFGAAEFGHEAGSIPSESGEVFHYDGNGTIGDLTVGQWLLRIINEIPFLLANRFRSIFIRV